MFQDCTKTTMTETQDQFANSFIRKKGGKSAKRTCIIETADVLTVTCDKDITHHC